MFLLDPPPFRPGAQVAARGRVRKRVRRERGGCRPPGESIENGAEKGGMTSTTTTAPTAADLTGSRVVAVAVAPQCSASVADGSNGMGPPPEKKVAKASRMAEEILEGRLSDRGVRAECIYCFAGSPQVRARVRLKCDSTAKPYRLRQFTISILHCSNAWRALFCNTLRRRYTYVTYIQ